MESLGRKKRTCSSAAARSSLLGVPILESCSSEATCAMARRSRERYLRRCRVVVARVSRTDPKSDMSISGSESAVDVRSLICAGRRRWREILQRFSHDTGHGTGAHWH